MNTNPPSFRFRGAGAFSWGPLAGVYASWPLVVLRDTDTGVELRIEPRWVGRVVAALSFAGVPEEAGVVLTAQDVHSAVAGRTRVAMRTTRGDLWFQTGSRARLDHVVADLRSKGFPVRILPRKPRWGDLERERGEE